MRFTSKLGICCTVALSCSSGEATRSDGADARQSAATETVQPEPAKAATGANPTVASSPADDGNIVEMGGKSTLRLGALMDLRSEDAIKYVSDRAVEGVGVDRVYLATTLNSVRADLVVQFIVDDLKTTEPFDFVGHGNLTIQRNGTRRQSMSGRATIEHSGDRFVEITVDGVQMGEYDSTGLHAVGVPERLTIAGEVERFCTLTLGGVDHQNAFCAAPSLVP